MVIVVGCLTVGAVDAGPATAAPATEAQMEATVLGLLNSERKLNRLPPLRLNAHLINSAHLHNTRMARFNLLTHQVRGELPFGARMTYYGYRWRAGAENVAWSSAISTLGAVRLHYAMYMERPPNNGHRLNILGRYRDVGIDVLIDPVHRKIWLTEDFGTS